MQRSSFSWSEMPDLIAIECHAFINGQNLLMLKKDWSKRNRLLFHSSPVVVGNGFRGQCGLKLFVFDHTTHLNITSFPNVLNLMVEARNGWMNSACLKLYLNRLILTETRISDRTTFKSSRTINSLKRTRSALQNVIISHSFYDLNLDFEAVTRVKCGNLKNFMWLGGAEPIITGNYFGQGAGTD